MVLAQSREQLAPGRATFVDVAYERLGREGRVELRGAVRAIGDPNIFPSVEVFDT